MCLQVRHRHHLILHQAPASTPAHATSSAPAMSAPAQNANNKQLENDIAGLKDQIRSLQTLVDTQKNLIQSQTQKLNDVTTKIEAIAQSTPLDKMTPMLDWH